MLFYTVDALVRLTTIGIKETSLNYEDSVLFIGTGLLDLWDLGGQAKTERIQESRSRIIQYVLNVRQITGLAGS